MKAHVIVDGIIVNTIEVSSLDFMPNLVEATAGSIGWHYTDESFIDPNLPSQDEVDAKHAAGIRQQRNSLLAETDWVVVFHTEKGIDIPLEWATYRQALRDITAHPNFPHLTDADWPTEPQG
jgi:hypothetical protein